MWLMLMRIKLKLKRRFSSCVNVKVLLCPIRRVVGGCG
jgi:hypothetical protein